MHSSVVALRSVRGAGLLLAPFNHSSAGANHEPIPLFARQIRADVDLAHLSNIHSHLLAWTNLKLPHRARRSENSQVSDIDAQSADCLVCQPQRVGTRKIPQRIKKPRIYLHTPLVRIIAFAPHFCSLIFHKAIAVRLATLTEMVVTARVLVKPSDGRFHHGVRFPILLLLRKLHHGIRHR